jgi:putative DNA primase/helicase
MVNHLVDGGVGPVTLEALDRAIGWGDYLETHSRRIYAQCIEPELPAARALAQKILERKLKSGFVVRDVYRPRWSRLATKEDATAAVECLVELDWLRREHIHTRGAPKTVHEINPAVFAPDFDPFAPD